MNFMHVLRKIFVFLLASILFFLLLFTMLLMTTRNLITKDNLSSYVEDAKILDMKANTLLNIGPEGKDITLREKISNMALNIGIPKEIVADILASRELNELLGEFFSGTVDYVLNGGAKPVLSPQTVDKMKRAALESSSKHINIILEDEELEQYMGIYIQELHRLLPERTQFIGKGMFINDLREFLNFKTVYLYMAMALLILLLSFMSKSIYKPLQYLSICMILAGVIFVIFGSADGFLNGFIIAQLDSMQAIISPLITNILTLWFKCGVLVSFSGIFVLILYAAIVRMVKHSEYRKEV